MNQWQATAKKPGGGDCVVGYYVDATGRVGAISGFLQLGTLREAFPSEKIQTCS